MADGKGYRVIENLWIPLPDTEARLAARLWLPDTPGPHPTILEYLPYRKRDGTAPRDATTHPVFAQHGYACLRVDIAGTGDSEGQFDDEYSEQELSHGEAVLDWITRQGWSDGNVGMIGISWGGFNGLQLAWRRPPALKAVVSVASTADRYADDIHFMGGCLLSDNVGWAAQMFAYLSRPADPLLRPDWREDWLARMRDLPDLAANWLRHPTRDTYWKHGSVCEDPSRIDIPVLAITGWADAYVNTPGWLAEHLPGPSKALIGPWEHRYPHISKLGAADFHGEVIRWFDRWLKSERNGAEDLPAFRTFCRSFSAPTGKMTSPAGRWIAENHWPSPNISVQRHYLVGQQLASTSGSGTRIVSNPAHLGQASGVFCAGMRIDNELPQDQAEDDAMSACFDLTLQNDLELMGRPGLRLRFSVDRPVAQIVARLCEVDNEGVSQRISYRPFNLTHHSGHETPTPLLPGQIYEVSFELNACAHRLRAGHRLRLALSTSYWPIVWPAPQAARITLHETGCALDLPVRQVADDIAPANPGPAAHAPEMPFENLRAARSEMTRTAAPDGTVTRAHFDDFGQARNLTHDMINGSKVQTHYEIHPDDPASARYTSCWKFTFERGDWRLCIETESRMSCDADNFHLSRTLRAVEGDAEATVLEREWSETLPRGLL